MNRKTVITLCMLLAALVYVRSKISATVGCKDYSKHGERRLGVDNKKLYYVKCDCDCKKYRTTDTRKCINCYHYTPS